MKEQKYIFKFQDVRDGNFAFVFSDTLENAKIKIKEVTSLKLRYIEYKEPIDLGTWIIFNKIKEN